ncbi:MAG: PEP-CTERM sorting domain-containing protein [Verrucomicrobiota bacterium]
MNKKKVLTASTACLLSLGQLHAAALLSPGDFIIAVDGNRNLPGNTNTGAEGPEAAFDGNNGSKWLSFGRAFTGLIVTPATAGTVVQSMAFTTGGDAPERDPVAYELYGTNAAVNSVNNGDGLAETWTLISKGATGIAPSSSPATARGTTAPTVSFANSIAYNSYKVVFPALRSANANAFDPVTLANGATPNSVQLGEVRMFNSTSTSIFVTAPTSTVAIDLTDSFYPSTERPSEAIDGSKAASSKHLNFGREGSGIIVTPGSGSSVVTAIELTTANDTPARDPAAFEIFGTNAPILSLDNSAGTAESWSLIATGSLTLPDARNTDGGIVSFANSTAYTSYKVLFTENKGPDASANSIQFSEIQLHSGIVPEPGAMALLGLSCLAAFRRRR